MMLQHIAALVFGFIVLTLLDGSPVLVRSEAVNIIRHRTSECKHGHGSAIRVNQTAMCVKETADEIRKKIDEDKQ
jgi:hypothetical protein